MDPQWWGVIAVLVVGALVVGRSWLIIRRARKLLAATERLPPQRSIPHFDGTNVVPVYVTRDDILGLYAGSTSQQAESTTMADLWRLMKTDGLTSTACLAANDFVNLAVDGVAIATAPLVVVCADEVFSTRELMPVFAQTTAAAPGGVPLVLVAPSFADEPLGTLRANHTMRLLQIVPVVCPDDHEWTRIAAITGTRPTNRRERQSGHFPGLGRCAAWASSDSGTWVLPSGRKAEMNETGDREPRVEFSCSSLYS